jgi:hypothetical protein
MLSGILESPQSKRRSTQELKPPDLKTIGRILREKRDEMERDFGVQAIGLFGSCVRKQAERTAISTSWSIFGGPLDSLNFSSWKNASADGWAPGRSGHPRCPETSYRRTDSREVIML